MINSRSHRLPAAFSGFKSKFSHPKRHTFSRSYGINLQSSLTRVLSSALGDCLPTHQSRFTVRTYVTGSVETFPGSVASATSGTEVPSYSVLGINEPPDLPRDSPYDLEQHCCCSPSLLRHPIAVMFGAGILTSFPSTTPFGLALGTD